MSKARRLNDGSRLELSKQRDRGRSDDFWAQTERALQIARQALELRNERARQEREQKDEPSKDSTGMQALTEEKDIHNVYKRRSGRSKRKSKWDQFKRKVIQATAETVDSKVLLAENRISVANEAGTQHVTSISLLGISGDEATATNQLHFQANDIANLFELVGVTSAMPNKKVRINTLHTEINIHCPNTTQLAMIYMYEVVLKKQLPDGIAATGNMAAIVGALEALDATPAAGQLAATAPDAIELHPARIGWTPFASPSVCKYLTVLNKKQIQLNGGKHIQFTYNKKINKTISRLDVDNFNFMPGLSRFFLITFYGRLVGAHDGSPSHNEWFPAVALNIDVLKTYHYDIWDTLTVNPETATLRRPDAAAA